MKVISTAETLLDYKEVYADDGIVEIRIVKLPAATIERPHGLKYSLFYGRHGERIICYDNEVGKGDHRHYRTREEPYVFSDLDKLIADFLSDVEKERKR